MDSLSILILCFSNPLTVTFGMIGFTWAAIQEWREAKNSMAPTVAKSSVIKTVYFYLVSLISLFMIVFATVDIVNIGLTTWVFTKADSLNYYTPPCSVSVPPAPGADPSVIAVERKNCEENIKQQEEQRVAQKQRDAVRDLSFVVIGVPLFVYHWSTIRRESKEEREEAKKTA